MKFKFLSLLIAILLLSACSYPEPHSERERLIQQLQTKGVSVNTVGETVDIILPSDQAFNEGSANLVNKYQPILKDVASLLKTYILVSVQVTGYSDLPADYQSLQALTAKQAQQVASYLWQHGIDARLVYSAGGANSKPVLAGASSTKTSANRRVEVVFRYYPPVSYYD